MAKYCTNCSTQNTDQAKFCRACGTKLANVEVPEKEKTTNTTSSSSSSSSSSHYDASWWGGAVGILLFAIFKACS